MKKTTKAFTLVEMLIVIVIIGILIASLMPRMQSAQGRARDVARKNDLSQIQTAIITSQQDRGEYPGMTVGEGETTADLGIVVSDIEDALQKAGMTSVPKDPNWSNVTFGLGGINTGAGAEEWEYIYLVGKRNWVSNAWFVLMAKTEVEWGSNWVVCDSWDDPDHGYIDKDDDLKDITTCSKVTEWEEGTCVSNTTECVYETAGQLRYILVN